MDYQKYIKSELLILVPAMYIIGLGLKKSKLADKWIPFALGIIGVALSALWVAATSPIATGQEVCRCPIHRRHPGRPCRRSQRLRQPAPHPGK